MTPTIGRIVHYYPYRGDGPWAAIITAVNADDSVNLMAFRKDGGMRPVIECFDKAAYDAAGENHASKVKNGYWDWPPRV